MQAYRARPLEVGAPFRDCSWLGELELAHREGEGILVCEVEDE